MSDDAELVYAVAKALHKAGYGDDVVEMHEAAEAAIVVVRAHQASVGAECAQPDGERDPGQRGG